MEDVVNAAKLGNPDFWRDRSVLVTGGTGLFLSAHG
jgi:hypothetical protein